MANLVWLCRALAVGLGLLVDSPSTQQLSFSAWNFARANVLQGISARYGVHPSSWYATQGLPMLLGLHLLPCLYEIIRILRGPKRESYDKLILFTVFSNVILYR